MLSRSICKYVNTKYAAIGRLDDDNARRLRSVLCRGLERQGRSVLEFSDCTSRIPKRLLPRSEINVQPWLAPINQRRSPVLSSSLPLSLSLSLAFAWMLRANTKPIDFELSSESVTCALLERISILRNSPLRLIQLT